MGETSPQDDAKVKEYLSQFGVEMPANDNKGEDPIAASRAAALEAIAKAQPGAEKELSVTRNLSAIEKQVHDATITSNISAEIAAAIAKNKEAADALESEVNGAARAVVEGASSKPPLDEKLIAEAVIIESPIEVAINPAPIAEAPVAEMYAPVPKVMPEKAIVGTAPEVVLSPEDIRLTPEMVEEQLHKNPEAVIEVPAQPEEVAAPEPLVEEKVEVETPIIAEKEESTPESEEEVVVASDNTKEEFEVTAESSIERSPLFEKLSPEVQARLKKIYESEPSSVGARIEWRIAHLAEIAAVLNEEVGDALEQKEIPRNPIARRAWLEAELQNLEQITAAEKERASQIERSIASLGAETLEKMDDELLKAFVETNAA